MRGRKPQPNDTPRLNYTHVGNGVKYFYRNGIMVGSEVIDDPTDPIVELEKLSKKLDKLKEPVYINGRKKRVTKETKLAIEKTQARYDKLHFELFPEDKPKRQYKKRK